MLQRGERHFFQTDRQTDRQTETEREEIVLGSLLKAVQNVCVAGKQRVSMSTL